MPTRTTIYLDSIVFEDDADTFRCTISDRKGNEVEVIACPPRFVDALKGAQTFWEKFLAKRTREQAEKILTDMRSHKRKA